MFQIMMESKLAEQRLELEKNGQVDDTKVAYFFDSGSNSKTKT